MKKFKTERDWKDLERADKIALLIGFVMWALLSSGVCVKNYNKHQYLQKNILKTEMVKHR